MRKYEVELEDYHGHFFHHRFEAKDDDEALNVDYSNTSTEHFKENIKKYHEIFKYLK